MARLNIEEQFWVEIAKVNRGKRSLFEIVGATVTLFRFAQERFRQGRIVSFEDVEREGFPESVMEVFAKKVEGGYQVYGSKKHFGWLETRAEAGSKGGLASGEKRRAISESNKINDLTEANPSKPKQTQANEPYISISSSNSISENTNTITPPAAAPPLHWLVNLWNENRTYINRKGSFPVVKSVSPKKLASIKLRLAERPEKEEWLTIFKNAAASDFLIESGFYDFWWLMKNEDNPRKVFQGNYKNKGAAKHFTHERTAEERAASDVDWDKIIDEEMNGGGNGQPGPTT